MKKLLSFAIVDFLEYITNPSRLYFSLNFILVAYALEKI